MPKAINMEIKCRIIRYSPCLYNLLPLFAIFLQAQIKTYVYEYKDSKLLLYFIEFLIINSEFLITNFYFLIINSASHNNNLLKGYEKSISVVEMLSFVLWVVMDSNHRSYKQQIYSLPHLATLETTL